MLDLCSISFQDVTSIPGHISVQVPSNISVYGITLIVKRELGPCTLNIRIYQSKEREEKQEMASSMKLRDFGFLGTLPPDEPEKLTLFYDYDYPLMDCPLLMANFSIWNNNWICWSLQDRVTCEEITSCAWLVPGFYRVHHKPPFLNSESVTDKPSEAYPSGLH